MNKVFYFDIDGTLLPHGFKKVSKETKYAIEELIRLGHEVFIATGKHYTVAKKLGDELGVVNFITTNGQQVHHKGELIFEKKFKLDEIEEIRAILEANKCTLGVQNFESNYILENEHMQIDQINQCFESVTLPSPKAHSNVLNDDILQLLIFGKNKNIIKLDKKYKLFHWHDFGGDILHVESSKANGIKQIKDIVKGMESYAFGDGENDVEMFMCVDNSVAMGNAKGHVKEKAKFITTTDKEHGVYQFLVDQGIIGEYVRK